MKISSEFWTIVVAIIVSLLIWGWAAGEDRDQRTLIFILAVDVPQGEQLVAQSNTQTIELTIEGTRRSLNAISTSSSNEVHLMLGDFALPLDPGRHDIALQDVLKQHPMFDDLGLNVLKCTPAAAVVNIDRLVEITAEIRHEAPNVRFEEITFDPPSVTVSLPAALSAPYARGIAVIAPMPTAQLMQLDPDRYHELVVTLQPPRALASNAHLQIHPRSVRARFKMRSQIRELVVDSVVVHLSGPEEDADDYSVQLTPDRLRDVTIRADADVIRRIEAGELRVIAQVHMDSRDKEIGVTSLPPTLFVALPVANDHDQERVGIAVTALFETTPQIEIRVEVRNDAPES